MLRIALALALLASTEASAHCYSRWYYPWPQRCGVGRQMVRLPTRSPLRVGHEAPFMSDTKPPSWESPEILLPSLARADLDGGEADEPTRAKILLRAALEAANGH